MKLIESFTGFQPLQEAWIGGTYPSKFYEDLPNQVEDTFSRITEQTLYGLKNLQNKLMELGVKVRAPRFTNNKEDYLDSFGNLIKPPIAPRDWAMTIGEQLWIIPQGYKVEPFADAINEYRDNGDRVEILERGPDPRSWLGFPGIVRFGKRLIVDTGFVEPSESSEYYDKIKQAVAMLEEDYDVINTDSGGHLDSVFCPIAKGKIFSSHWGEKSMYEKSTPGWEVFWLDTKENDNVNGRWWTSENNYYSPIFNQHVNQKAQDWVGDSRETVFEANMLVVDESNVICIAEHDQSFRKMEQLGITPHVVDFPTRHFWDGGIHCITVDIRRTGGCVDYFNG